MMKVSAGLRLDRLRGPPLLPALSDAGICDSSLLGGLGYARREFEDFLADTLHGQIFEASLGDRATALRGRPDLLELRKSRVRIPEEHRLLAICDLVLGADEVALLPRLPTPPTPGPILGSRLVTCWHISPNGKARSD